MHYGGPVLPPQRSGAWLAAKSGEIPGLSRIGGSWCHVKPTTGPDLTLAGLYADRLALLHQGHVVASGDAAHVLRPETPVRPDVRQKVTHRVAERG